MNLTEDEAKQRWCPFAQVGFGGRIGGTMNRLQVTGQDASGQTVEQGVLKIPMGAKCIASQCMAWRAVGPEKDPQPWVVTLPGKKEPERYAWDPQGHPGYESAMVQHEPRQPISGGRCGLTR